MANGRQGLNERQKKIQDVRDIADVAEGSAQKKHARDASEAEKKRKFEAGERAKDRSSMETQTLARSGVVRRGGGTAQTAKDNRLATKAARDKWAAAQQKYQAQKDAKRIKSIRDGKTPAKKNTWSGGAPIRIGDQEYRKSGDAAKDTLRLRATSTAARQKHDISTGRAAQERLNTRESTIAGGGIPKPLDVQGMSSYRRAIERMREAQVAQRGTQQPAPTAQAPARPAQPVGSQPTQGSVPTAAGGMGDRGPVGPTEIPNIQFGTHPPPTPQYVLPQTAGAQPLGTPQAPYGAGNNWSGPLQGGGQQMSMQPQQGSTYGFPSPPPTQQAPGQMPGMFSALGRTMAAPFQNMANQMGQPQAPVAPPQAPGQATPFDPGTLSQFLNDPNIMTYLHTLHPMHQQQVMWALEQQVKDSESGDMELRQLQQQQQQMGGPIVPPPAPPAFARPLDYGERELSFLPKEGQPELKRPEYPYARQTNDRGYSLLPEPESKRALAKAQADKLMSEGSIQREAGKIAGGLKTDPNVLDQIQTDTTAMQPGYTGRPSEEEASTLLGSIQGKLRMGKTVEERAKIASSIKGSPAYNAAVKSITELETPSAWRKTINLGDVNVGPTEEDLRARSSLEQIVNSVEKALIEGRRQKIKERNSGTTRG